MSSALGWVRTPGRWPIGSGYDQRVVAHDNTTHRLPLLTSRIGIWGLIYFFIFFYISLFFFWGVVVKMGWFIFWKFYSLEPFIRRKGCGALESSRRRSTIMLIELLCINWGGWGGKHSDEQAF